MSEYDKTADEIILMAENGPQARQAILHALRAAHEAGREEAFENLEERMKKEFVGYLESMIKGLKVK